ncbi:MAG TPA: hypothetical protein DEB25_03855 [Desulfobulbaceae bacterium]|nr:hypothetical protein [Desulfobulbaceae bacterium]
MEFIETPVFTRSVTALLTDDEYRLFQTVLANDPERGDLIQGSHGLRKIRVAAKGQGKRGGARVVYYWMTAKGQIYLLVIYPKNRKDDLNAGERAALSALVKQELSNG